MIYIAAYLAYFFPNFFVYTIYSLGGAIKLF